MLGTACILLRKSFLNQCFWSKWKGHTGNCAGYAKNGKTIGKIKVNIELL